MEEVARQGDNSLDQTVLNKILPSLPPLKAAPLVITQTAVPPSESESIASLLKTQSAEAGRPSGVLPLLMAS